MKKIVVVVYLQLYHVGIYIKTTSKSERIQTVQ